MHSILTSLEGKKEPKSWETSPKCWSWMFLYFANTLLTVYMLFDICAILAHSEKSCTEFQLAGHFQVGKSQKYLMECSFKSNFIVPQRIQFQQKTESSRKLESQEANLANKIRLQGFFLWTSQIKYERDLCIPAKLRTFRCHLL